MLLFALLCFLVYFYFVSLLFFKEVSWKYFVVFAAAPLVGLAMLYCAPPVDIAHHPLNRERPVRMRLLFGFYDLSPHLPSTSLHLRICKALISRLCCSLYNGWSIVHILVDFVTISSICIFFTSPGLESYATFMNPFGNILIIDSFIHALLRDRFTARTRGN